MQSTLKKLSDTSVQLTLTADATQLETIKDATLATLAKEVKIPGFRSGKAPLSLVEKHVNPGSLQTEFLDRAMNELYGAALDEHSLRPVAQPEVRITKFVPFTTLEIEATVPVVGTIKLADYKKVRVAKKEIKVTAKDVEDVIDQLRTRDAEKKDVDRAAKDGDQTVIDFKGVDSKTKEPISGAEGSDYPLPLGSGTFIPGFEPELIGLKAGDTKTFTVTFPKDYNAKELQNKKVDFTVTVKQVQELVQPKLDDAFAAKVGPFKTMADLKADIKTQLQKEKDAQNNREYADEVLQKVTTDSQMTVPESLVDEQVDRMVSEQKQNIVYRGQTWKEYLDAQGQSEDEYRTSIRPDAELRVKAGFILGEVAEQEKLTITPDELDLRMELLKGQYQDAQMQAELEKPETRREIASRLLSEKTADALVGYASAKK